MLRKNNGYMPDVLDCLANLSNDEVFTPPEVANKMLDLLPQELFESKDTKFLDPFTKSGVFLREITKRLLRNQLPDYETVSSEIDIIEKEAIQNAVKNNELDLNDPYYSEKARKIGHDAVERHERAEEFNLFERRLQRELNRIFSTQVFGIAITELTAQLARRSLYCSKNAAGKYSVSSDFDTEEGNIRFKPMKHTWKDGSCIYCGANQNMFDRPDDFEQHAYEFIHNKKVEEIFMGFQFDAIVGNPPYQLNVGGGGKGNGTAVPIYNEFVEKAKQLNPKYLTMIIPARWYSGGRGLDSFRKIMLEDKRLVKLIDIENSKECFPGVDIAGGVCYFLWDRDAKVDKCIIENHFGEEKIIRKRNMNEYDTFIRNNTAVDIVKKVLSQSEKMMDKVVSPVSLFGFNTNANFSGEGDVDIRYSGGLQKCNKSDIRGGKEILDKYKVIISAATYDHGGQPDKNGQRRILSRVEVLKPNCICTSTYIVVDSFDKEEEAENLKETLKTTFIRFLLSQICISQHISRDTFAFVPVLDYSKKYTDEDLYKKYGLTEKEIEFVKSKIKPMDNVTSENSKINGNEEDGDKDD